MKRILRDVPTSILLLIGMFVLLFVACYSVNFVSESARLNSQKTEEIYKNTLYYYLYDGDVTVNGNTVTVIGSGMDIIEAATVLRSDSLNIAFRLYFPFENVMYSSKKNELGADALDVYTSYHGELIKSSNGTNTIYLNEIHDELVKNNKITLLSVKYNVVGRIDGRMSGIVIYDNLNDNAKSSLMMQAKKDARIKVIVGSDSDIDMNEIERIKEVLSDKGFKLLEDKDYVNLKEEETVSLVNGTMVCVGGGIFVLITLFILIKLWLVKRIEGIAILWCHGKSKYGIFVFLAKEMSLVYGMATVVFAVFALLYSLCIRSMPLIYIPIAIIVAYVLLMIVAIMVYEESYRKLSMLSVISGGVE